jgi:hypothetical protein
MSEEQSNFKVTDRRLFNADGSPREVPPEEKAAQEKAPVEATANTTAAPAAEANNRSAAAPPETPSDVDASLGEADAEFVGAEDPASFANFLMSIASNAASSLGMMEHPVTGKRDVDLELGKHWIDVLVMLKQKTQGNLSSQEQRILESLLADLQMQFVSLSSATPKANQAYTSRDITGG